MPLRFYPWELCAGCTGYPGSIGNATCQVEQIWGSPLRGHDDGSLHNFPQLKVPSYVGGAGEWGEGKEFGVVLQIVALWHIGVSLDIYIAHWCPWALPGSHGAMAHGVRLGPVEGPWHGAT